MRVDDARKSPKNPTGSLCAIQQKVDANYFVIRKDLIHRVGDVVVRDINLVGQQLKLYMELGGQQIPVDEVCTVRDEFGGSLAHTRGRVVGVRAQTSPHSCVKTGTSPSSTPYLANPAHVSGRSLEREGVGVGELIVCLVERTGWKKCQLLRRFEPVRAVGMTRRGREIRRGWMGCRCFPNQ